MDSYNHTIYEAEKAQSQSQQTAYRKIRVMGTTIEKWLNLEPASHVQSFTVLVASSLLDAEQAVSILHSHLMKVAQEVHDSAAAKGA